MLIIIISEMGNEGNRPNSASDGQKIILRLRNREILLHYAFKMKLMISDIALFPHELEGLRLWDSDIILARFAILQSDRFRGKDVVVFKAGVGIAGIALKKWTDCKEVVMCDTRDEVVNNMSKNCEKNGVRGLNCCKIDLKDLSKTTAEFDCLLCADILNNGFAPQLILQIFRKLLKDGGQAIIVMPERKELARKFLEIVDKAEFKISNLILTAEQYETSPLFNKLEGASEFPQLTSNFYAISLTRVRIDHKKLEEQKKNIIKLKPVLQEERQNKEKLLSNEKAIIKEASFKPKQKIESSSIENSPKDIEKKQEVSERLNQAGDQNLNSIKNQPPKQPLLSKPHSQQQFEDIPETKEENIHSDVAKQASASFHPQPATSLKAQPSIQCKQPSISAEEARQQPRANSDS